MPDRIETNKRKHVLDQESILYRLAQISTSPAISDLLHDLFFEFIVEENKFQSVGEKRLYEIRRMREEIMELYRLVRKAKKLRKAQSLMQNA